MWTNINCIINEYQSLWMLRHITFNSIFLCIHKFPSSYTFSHVLSTQVEPLPTVQYGCYLIQVHQYKSQLSTFRYPRNKVYYLHLFCKLFPSLLPHNLYQLYILLHFRSRNLSLEDKLHIIHCAFSFLTSRSSTYFCCTCSHICSTLFMSNILTTSIITGLVFTKLSIPMAWSSSQCFITSILESCSTTTSVICASTSCGNACFQI
ncbi:unnamed protein product [Paramecium octaurelia]|uniref:Uncharacterized protein n=1 Tax=Paramecium octaurelia TaxID=43137 RepID=A0A8S1YE52_PAROT|nr:unnamed protein product [Paramecium octaurelia]